MEMDDMLRRPLLDEVWELDLDTKKWRKLHTIGDTPGPRSGAHMFAIDNNLYMWGGRSAFRTTDNKLYCLELGPDGKGVNNTYKWKVIKTKGSVKPPPREDFGAVYYKGKYYIMGGLTNNKSSDELWSLNMSTLKWTCLKPGSVKRHNHRMWAGRGKLFVLGGRTFKEGVENPHMATYSISNFDKYDIEQGVWSATPIIGDKPYDISEYCTIPLYDENKGDEEEAASVIVWGGYTAVDQAELMKAKSHQAYGEDRYGAEARDFFIPYRKRLLRYEFDTNAWIKLDSTTNLLPKAESWAAKLQSENGQLKLLIGGGYGYTQSCGEDKKEKCDQM